MGITPIWPEATVRDAQGAIAFHGITAEQLLNDFGSPLYVLDLDEVRARARRFAAAAAHAFSTTTTHVSYAGKAFLSKEMARIVTEALDLDEVRARARRFAAAAAHAFSTTTTHVSYAGKAFLSKEMARIVTEAGLYVDTCTMGEMRIALAAGVPGRRLVLHGNNKSDAEIELAITEGFAKIVIDEPDEPARIGAIARRLGKRARVMLRVTTGIHAGGHEFISTAQSRPRTKTRNSASRCCRRAQTRRSWTASARSKTSRRPPRTRSSPRRARRRTARSCATTSATRTTSTPQA